MAVEDPPRVIDVINAPLIVSVVTTPKSRVAREPDAKIAKNARSARVDVFAARKKDVEV